MLIPTLISRNDNLTSEVLAVNNIGCNSSEFLVLQYGCAKFQLLLVASSRNGYTRYALLSCNAVYEREQQ